MMLSIWNYIRGYVIIKVTGFSVERFINLAIFKEIYFWDVEHKDNAVFMKVSIKGFKMLRDCSHKTKCKAIIVEKKGLPFAIFKYRKRKVLAVGILVFVFLLYFMSSFIWVVELTGNKRLASDEILSFLSENNLHQATLKRSINTTEITSKLLNQFTDISFASIALTGTKAKINIVETIPSPPIVDKNTPCDIVAKKDGLVLSIITSAGTPLVKEKDVVQKGDILVSSKIYIKSESEVKDEKYIHASAVVYAKLWYEVTLKEKFTYIEKKYTGKTKKKTGVSILGTELLVKSNSPYKYYDTTTTQNALHIREFNLPITVITTKFVEYTPVTKTYNEEALQQKLSDRLDIKILEELDKNTEILGIKKDFAKEENQLILKAIVTTKERIDAELK